MLVARVVGSVVCTVHTPALANERLIVCELEGRSRAGPLRVAAVDTLAARVGDQVLLGLGRRGDGTLVAVTVGLVDRGGEA